MTIRVNRDGVFHHVRNTDVLKIPAYANLAGVGDEPGMEGDIILDRSTMQFCFHNGVTWVCLTTVTLDDDPSCDASLIIDGIGPDLSIRGLSEGPGIVLTEGGSCVTIGTDITLSDACGTGVTLVNEHDGPDLAIKGLVAGDGITLSSDSSCVTIGITGYEFIEAVSLASQTLQNNIEANLGNWVINTPQSFGDAIIKSTDNIYDFEVKEDGIYIVQATVTYENNPTGDRALIIYMNNVNKGNVIQSTARLEPTSLQCYARTALSTGDRIRLAAYQTSGGDLDVNVSSGINELTISRER